MEQFRIWSSSAAAHLRLTVRVWRPPSYLHRSGFPIARRRQGFFLSFIHSLCLSTYKCAIAMHVNPPRLTDGDRGRQPADDDDMIPL